MDAETIFAVATALSGPAGGLLVMGFVLYGVYKTATTILTPFLPEVGSGIKKGFDDQTTTLGKLVEEIKDDVSDIKKIVEK